MNKYRDIVCTDDGLRLQEVVPDGTVGFTPPGAVHYPVGNESPETVGEVVVALTWPQETGWRSH